MKSGLKLPDIKKSFALIMKRYYSVSGATMKIKVLAVCLMAFLSTTSALAQNVDGFGRNVPLAMAIQTLVPKNIRVTYTYGVDNMLRVTYQGNDRPWRIVLDEVAAKHNLIVTQRGNDLRISLANPNLPAYETARNAPAVQNTGADFVPYDVPENRHPDTNQVMKPEVEVISGTGFRINMPVQEPVRTTVQEPISAAGAPWGTPPPVQAESTVTWADDNQHQQAQVAAPAQQKIGLKKVINNTYVTVENGVIPEVERPAIPVKVIKPYVVEAGSDLKKTLETWAQREGWRIQWNIPASYELGAQGSFNGTFTEALSQLISKEVMGDIDFDVKCGTVNKICVFTDKATASSQIVQ